MGRRARPFDDGARSEHLGALSGAHSREGPMNMDLSTNLAKKAAQKKPAETDPPTAETQATQEQAKLPEMDAAPAPTPEASSRPRWDEVSVSQITPKMRA